MKNKLKIYSVLLVVVLVASVCKYLNVYHHSWTNRPGEELILDSLNENFAKIDINTQTWADTIDGTPVTQTSANWHAQDKCTFEIGVPVRKRGGLDHYLYSRLTNGQQVMVDMQTVKIKIPIEESQKNIPFVFSVVLAFAFVPFYIWLFVIVWKILRSVYKGEVFVTQIAKGLVFCCDRSENTVAAEAKKLAIRFIEELGYYAPLKDPVEIKIDEEAAKKWLETGAQPTETVKKLFKQAGIL